MENLNPDKEEISIKESRIRSIATVYYSRPDIRKAIFEFSKNRECIPRYFEGFGKRPDTFHYDSDILELARKGATSFHCSEEIWQDPLELNTEMKEQDIKKLRTGWDLLIDVDSKYIDYSKIYAEILVSVLKAHNIRNIGVKFSGSKGWHILIPWKAFPKEMSGNKTCEMFPEWPRLICQYLNSKIAEELKERVLEIQDNNKAKQDLTETYCRKCNNLAEKKSLIIFRCPSCKTQMQNIQDVFSKKRKIRCPNCQIEMLEERKEPVLLCPNCKISSKESKDNFQERVQSRHIDADLVLVSPRHLFRMPYSLHEKTSLASVVIDSDKIKDFDLRDADPLRIKPRDFLPEVEEGEATMLLRNALEFKPPKTYEQIEQQKSKSIISNKEFKDITIKNLSSKVYPPSINKILEGMKTDGRKRALFILLSFFKSLKLSDEELQTQIENWNKKNYEPLPQSYIKGQVSWYSKQKETKLPPNFDKTYYKDIGINPTTEELASKNPVSYTIKKALRKK